MSLRLFRLSSLSLAGIIIMVTSCLAFFSNMMYLSQKQPVRVVFRKTALRNVTFNKKSISTSSTAKVLTAELTFFNTTKLSFSEVLNQVPVPKEAIMTMFTSFRYSAKKETIHKNTLRNWSLLRPYVMPLLFADRDELNDDLYNLAISLGWSIATIPKRSPGGLPVLRHMYIEAEKLYNTSLYCFANSDILFDNGLIRTLELAILPYRSQLQGLMLVGKRTNVAVEVNQQIKSFDEVTELAKKGVLFGENAQDYFVTTRGGFPWEQIPNFVIGRNGYDNWLVAYAMKRRLTTIDGTNTILAFHQSGHDGDFAWKAQKSELDINVKMGGRKIFYKIGHTDCTPFLTKSCPQTSNTTTTNIDKDLRQSCPYSIILAKRTIDHCYRLRRRLSFKPSRLINFKERSL